MENEGKTDISVAHATECGTRDSPSDLDISKSTAQTAIIASLFMGRGLGGRGHEQRGVFAPTAGRVALRSILGYIVEAYEQTHAASLQEEATFYRRRTFRDVWRAFADLYSTSGGTSDTEFVVIPVDGLGDLLRGHGNAMSLMAVAPSGTFCRPLSEPYDNLLVFAVGPSIAKCIQADDLPTVSAGMSALALVEPILNTFVELARKHIVQFTVATEELKQVRSLQKVVSRNWRMRTLPGSSAAGGIMAAMGSYGIDAFASIVNPIEAAFIAAAAQITGGALYGIPVRGGSKPGTEPLVVGSELLETDGIVPRDRDVFLAMTAVSESLILRGVRYRDEDTLSTHTLCMRKETGSTRFISHRHHLKSKVFYVLDETKRQNWICQYESILEHVSQSIEHSQATKEAPKPR